MSDHDIVEREYMGKSKSKVWTYLILMFALVGIALALNLVWNDPHRASEGIKSFFGLPGWALATVMFIVGALVFVMGLKIETDWPEAFGAFLISGSIVWMEVIVGWNRFAPGHLVVLPYIIPIAVFVLLLMYGMKKSV
jgi:hypothetical protein